MKNEPDLSLLPPLHTTWHERSRSNIERVMYEMDAFGDETGRIRVDRLATGESTTFRILPPPGDELSPLPADPPIVIHRQQVPWWKISLIAGAFVAIAQVIERLTS